MSIDLVKIRATVKIGNSVSVSTPYIQSFNVRKSRGQLSTFDAALKVEYEQVNNNIGGGVSITAGTESNQNLIFTGILKKATIGPCWDDPGYVILNISGTDVLSKLQGKKYTRRCRATHSTWVSINSVNRKGLRGGTFNKEINSLLVDGGESLNNRENTKASRPIGSENVPKSGNSTSVEVVINRKNTAVT